MCIRDSSEDAKTWYEKFIEYCHEIVNKEHHSYVINRLQVNVYKLAILLAVSEDRTKTITADHFQRAYDILDKTMEKDGIARLMSGDTRAALTQYIYDTLEAFGGTLSHSKLMQKVWRRVGDS